MSLPEAPYPSAITLLVTVPIMLSSIMKSGSAMMLLVTVPIMLSFIMKIDSASCESKDSITHDLENKISREIASRQAEEDGVISYAHLDNNNREEITNDALTPIKGIGYRYPSRIIERNAKARPLPGHKLFQDVHDWDAHYWRIVTCLGEHFLSVAKEAQLIYKLNGDHMYSLALEDGLDELYTRLENHQKAKSRGHRESTGIGILHWEFARFIWRMNPPDIQNETHITRLMGLRRQALLIAREVEAMKLMIEIPPRGASEVPYLELPEIIDGDLEFGCVKAMNSLGLGPKALEKRMKKKRWNDRDPAIRAEKAEKDKQVEKNEEREKEEGKEQKENGRVERDEDSTYEWPDR